MKRQAIEIVGYYGSQSLVVYDSEESFTLKFSVYDQTHLEKKYFGLVVKAIGEIFNFESIVTSDIRENIIFEV